MKRHQTNFRQFWDDFFGRFRELPPPSVDSAWDRVLDRLRDHPDDLLVGRPAIPIVQRRSKWRRGVLLAAATTAAVLVVLMRMPVGLHAVVESADGGLFRVSGGQAVRVGEKVAEGDIVRTERGLGTVLALADGSRIEMRPQSSLSLERADDGVRIRLDTGGVIIVAAKQRSGHLYVQTRDAIVSVVGTVFLVSTEQAGSRVAVIQGEVQVQLGAVINRLAPGQQVATNPLMEAHPIREEISWSRESEAHIALLQQSTAARPGGAVASSKKLEFEAASLKPFPLQINNPAPPKRLSSAVASMAFGLLQKKVAVPATLPRFQCRKEDAWARRS
jgi:ferric-dicitrate binding protein FerR (iron transport regulator)